MTPPGDTVQRTPSCDQLQGTPSRGALYGTPRRPDPGDPPRGALQGTPPWDPLHETQSRGHSRGSPPADVLQKTPGDTPWGPSSGPPRGPTPGYHLQTTPPGDRVEEDPQKGDHLQGTLTRGLHQVETIQGTTPLDPLNLTLSSETPSRGLLEGTHPREPPKDPLQGTTLS
jgi:hypothetical protein